MIGPPIENGLRGLMRIDESEDVRPGERYLYRVSLADRVREKRVGPGNVLKCPEERQKLPKPDMVGIEWGDRTASLTWDTKREICIYSAYYLEKSTDSINYGTATDLPIVGGSENREQTKTPMLTVSPITKSGSISGCVT
jgi:hypothetical protein